MTGWEVVLVVAMTVAGFCWGACWMLVVMRVGRKPMESPSGERWLCEHGHWHDALADAVNCPKAAR